MEPIEVAESCNCVSVLIRAGTASDACLYQWAETMQNSVGHLDLEAELGFIVNRLEGQFRRFDSATIAHRSRTTCWCSSNDLLELAFRRHRCNRFVCRPPREALTFRGEPSAGSIYRRTLTPVIGPAVDKGRGTARGNACCGRDRRSSGRRRRFGPAVGNYADDCCGNVTACLHRADDRCGDADDIAARDCRFANHHSEVTAMASATTGGCI